MQLQKQTRVSRMLEQNKIKMMPLLVNHFLLRITSSDPDFFNRRLFGLKFEQDTKANFFFAIKSKCENTANIQEYMFETDVVGVINSTMGFNYDLDILTIDLRPTEITLLVDDISGIDTNDIEATFTFFNGRSKVELPINVIAAGGFAARH